ncbi:MAG: VWA domain-containing protein [Halodesulfurarchaeum sp.]|nr:VWA domain-containing protein [Halodesulfurarchaeum sp.]
MHIDSSTDPEAVSAHLDAETASLRESEARADRLQRDARIRTGRWDLVVRIESGFPPATLTVADGTPTVTLSGDPVLQPVTAYPEREYHLLVQRVWVLHELTHLEYTDFADLDDRLEQIAAGYRPVAAALWNAFEDAAIEATIRDRWPNYGEWIRTVRRNLLVATGPGIPDPDGGFVYPMAQAAVLAVMDGTVIESGPLSELLDSATDRHHFHTDADRERFESTVLPAIEETKRSRAGVTDPTERNRLAIECFDEIRGVIAEADADGRAQVAAWAGNHWGMPDDASHGPLSTETEPLPAIEIGGDGAERADRNRPADSTAGDQVELQQNGSSGSDDRSEGAESGDESPLDEQLSTDLAAEIEAQRRQGRSIDERRESLEDLQAAVSAAETELESDGVVIPTDDPVPHEPTRAAAEADGTRLARVLKNRFQKQRKRSIQRNTRRGRLDPAALHRHATGDRRVKQRRERPDETEHRCLFVLDRSGSMRQHVRVAEQAMGMLAVALEAVDVDVSVLELLDKEVRLAKPVDRSVDRAAGRLYHGDVGGGTPLTDTLHIAREYLKRADGNRFVIVVTDGRPSEPDRYREALNRFTVPVLGVNLTTDEAAGESEFHRQVTVPPETEQLRRALRQLVQEVLFE